MSSSAYIGPFVNTLVLKQAAHTLATCSKYSIECGTGEFTGSKPSIPLSDFVPIYGRQGVNFSRVCWRRVVTSGVEKKDTKTKE